MPYNNKTFNFFAENPKYIEIIEEGLVGDERSIIVLKRRLDKETLQDISAEFRCTREYIRQVEEHGLKRMKYFITRIQ
jgi:DNA-directed RNA polymerase sigma subunit (sigma70/sigma32)